MRVYTNCSELREQDLARNLDINVEIEVDSAQLLPCIECNIGKRAEEGAVGRTGDYRRD